MSEKNRDNHNRWRSLTIAFRVSPEENDDINMRVRLSGLTKQDYLIHRCQDRAVVVQGNPRVYKALKGSMAEIITILHDKHSNTPLDPLHLKTLEMIAVVLSGLNKEDLA